MPETILPPVTVETEIWGPDFDKPGYQKLERRRTIREVCDDLHAILGPYPEGGEESFGIFPTLAYKDPPPEWPKGRIAVFAITGANEGHYVHVEVHDQEKRVLVLLGKTFAGKDAAWKFARRLADLLQA